MQTKYTSKDAQRFWSKVKLPDMIGTDECWEWQAGKYKTGYGEFGHNGRACGSHRIAYEVTLGNIPAGLSVCHSCDNRACVNPAHLWIGSRSDNIHDMRQKGRHAFGKRCGVHTHPESYRGEKSAAHKLTEAQVIDIRKRYALGDVFMRQLAVEFNVTKSAIAAIVWRKSWIHIE